MFYFFFSLLFRKGGVWQRESDGSYRDGVIISSRSVFFSVFLLAHQVTGVSPKCKIESFFFIISHDIEVTINPIALANMI